MGLLYKIYQTVQEGHEREHDVTDGQAEMEGGALEADLPVSLVHLLANPIGRASGEQA